MARPMPRLFLIRHGETEWSKNGDIPLTARGEEQIKCQAQILVGDGKIIDPKNLCTVFVSPRQRAHKTFHLLFDHVETPHHIITEEVREWDYGQYEGLLPSEIQARNPGWKIWKDGCPDGESVEEMQNRVDIVIKNVREYHRQYKEEGLNTRDVVIVAHGHFSRVLLARWIRFSPPPRYVKFISTNFNVEPGGVAVLGYNHNNLEEPAMNALNLYAELK
ncbi:histidine phosphatase superfamily [Desarmillaria tabescens]|uniref:Histidine phosphatase superfamily n=1 Tax=Armillaria tabescens TaxID=1929756 RepID=A0AA39NG85_ARMTA|nr:histidine phosphatase superfamily [Desarmillaria tabescens]KAK0464959.1 histidine phosphatase superfamily [Desarmillaria tabescens]